MGNKIRAVVFDMDGVLIDAKEWHYEALNMALEESNQEPISRYAHLEIYDGLPTKMKLKKHLADKNLSEEMLSKINERKQEITTDVIAKSCAPNLAHIETLKFLKGEGYQVSVASNSIRSSVIFMLEKADLLEMIDFYLSNQDVKNSKPSPEIYNKTIEKMGFKPREVLICEDNIRGITAAMESGAFVLEIGTIDDVNIENIKKAIRSIESENLKDRLLRPAIRYSRLSEMPGGWFVGDFYPNILKTKDFEVAVKEYTAGDSEQRHVHKVGTEVTLVLDGKAKMNGKTLKHGDIILLEPHQSTDFEALTDLKTVVVKTPSAPGDKYML